jgi:hypothetical protein
MPVAPKGTIKIDCMYAVQFSPKDQQALAGRQWHPAAQDVLTLIAGLYQSSIYWKSNWRLF